MALMGPGALTEYDGGPRRSRQRGSVRVQEPAHAFFVAGSSLDAMNGIFGRVRPEAARAVSAHSVNLCYKHDQSGWFMALIKVCAVLLLPNFTTKTTTKTTTTATSTNNTNNACVWFTALIKAPADERPYAYRTYG